MTRAGHRSFSTTQGLRYHGAFSANHKLRARIVPRAPPAQTAALSPNKRKPRRVRAEGASAAAAVAQPPVATLPDVPLSASPRTALAAVNKPLDWATLLKRVWSI